MTKKTRLDLLLVQRGLVRSRERGKRLIMAGEVLIDGQPFTKPGMKVPTDAAVTIKERPPFVSRGGEKLAGALANFAIDPTGFVCADLGASTGGFTDCLLQNGAVRVYAIDVGYGQLAWPLRQDERVIVMERTNARYLQTLPEPVHLVVVDASFISLQLLMPAFRGWLTPHGQAVVLVKPQFEAGREQVGKGGVVRERDTHASVLTETAHAALAEGFAVYGMTYSPIKGPAGNIEFLMWLGLDPRPVDIPAMVAQVVHAAHAAL